MSRIEAGGLKVNRDFVDVADVVQGAVERSRKAFPKQPVKVNLAPDLPFVRGDDKLLEQVLFNLLDNAHKYAADSGAAIHARRDGDEVVLSVTDEGPGVKPADLEKIFEKFYRGGRADGRKPGTGLGLSICRGLIEVDGRNDRGAKPGGAAQGNPYRHSSSGGRAVRHRHEGGSMTPAGACRVLVVDDEPQIQRFLHVALTAAGYEVVSAETGAQAVRMARRPARPTSSCSISACPIGTARRCCATSGPSRKRR